MWFPNSDVPDSPMFLSAAGSTGRSKSLPGEADVKGCERLTEEGCASQLSTQASYGLVF